MMYFNLLKNMSFLAYWSSTTFLRVASNVLQFALAVYVLDMTGSAVVFSTVLSVIIFPRILATPVSGYLADFKNCLHILRLGTLGLTGLMFCFFVIHAAVLPLNIWLIYVLVICLEFGETLISACESKALVCIVSDEQIAAASKMSSLDDGIVEILSPVIAGFAYGLLGLESVLAVTLSIEAMAFLLTLFLRPKRGYRFDSHKDSESHGFSIKATVNIYKEAFYSLKNHKYMFGIILFAPLFNFFVNPLFSVTIPHYFRITMGAGTDMLAMFNAALGVAGLIAPFAAMWFIKDEAEDKANLRGTAFSGVLLAFLSAILCLKPHIGTKILYIVTGLMMLIVSAITIMNIASTITIKKNIPEAMLGRIISVIQLCAVISIPLGQLFYGFLADYFPLAVACMISAVGLCATYAIMMKTYVLIKRK